ncbi:hypothetical protein C8R48DRAFT_676680 [Suillus tomentosus]|nr:hypothetical protein C8R48DRAFT_676680 [Suillus tomentosus]
MHWRKLTSPSHPTYTVPITTIVREAGLDDLHLNSKANKLALYVPQGFFDRVPPNGSHVLELQPGLAQALALGWLNVHVRRPNVDSDDDFIGLIGGSKLKTTFDYERPQVVAHDDVHRQDIIRAHSATTDQHSAMESKSDAKDTGLTNLMEML